MTKAGKFFRSAWAEITLLFGKHLPKEWESLTESTITFLNTLKSIELSTGAVTLAGLIPNGIGTIALAEIQKLTVEGIASLEIAKGCEVACEGLTTDQEKADAIFNYIITHTKDLPAEWQGKHWEDIAVKILESLLNISTTEAKAIVNVKYGQMKAAE